MEQDCGKQQRSGENGNPSDASSKAEAEHPSNGGHHDAADDTADPLRNRQWIHESGYGGRGGTPRSSSDEREAREHTVHTGDWPEFSPDLAEREDAVPAPGDEDAEKPGATRIPTRVRIDGSI